jgi:hypothetical protein
MALAVVEPKPWISKPLEPPPKVAITPCDPWPRPYFLEGGLRRVEPYHYTYNTYVKERWRGREILDVFATEFRDRPMQYYVRLRIVSIYVGRGRIHGGVVGVANYWAEKCNHKWQSHYQREECYSRNGLEERRCHFPHVASP